MAAAVPGVSSIQRRLAADQALLEYVVGPESLVVFVLTSRGLAVKSSPLREPDLAARLAAFRGLGRLGSDADGELGRLLSREARRTGAEESVILAGRVLAVDRAMTPRSRRHRTR